MNIETLLEFNRMRHRVEIQALTAKDVAEIEMIRELTYMPGWDILVKYETLAREQILDALSSCASSQGKLERAQVLSGVFRGFEERRILTDKLFKKVEEYWDEKNGTGGDDNVRDGENAPEL